MKTLFKTAILCIAVPLSVHSVYGQSTQTQDLEKTKWIKEQPTLYLKQGGQNEIVPEFTTKTEKENWFNNNSSLSPSKILPNGDIIFPGKTEVRQRVIITDDATFPVYSQTGNQQVDDQNYNQRKQDWISKNQDKYNSMVQPAPSNPISKEKRLKLDSQSQN